MLYEGFDFNSIPTSASTPVRASKAILDTVYNYYKNLHIEELNKICSKSFVNELTILDMIANDGVWYINRINLITIDNVKENPENLKFNKENYEFYVYLIENNIRFNKQIFNTYTDDYISLLTIYVENITPINKKFIENYLDNDNYDFLLSIHLSDLILDYESTSAIENMINHIKNLDTKQELKFKRIYLANITFCDNAKLNLYIHTDICIDYSNINEISINPITPEKPKETIGIVIDHCNVLKRLAINDPDRIIQSIYVDNCRYLVKNHVINSENVITNLDLFDNDSCIAYYRNNKKHKL